MRRGLVGERWFLRAVVRNVADNLVDVLSCEEEDEVAERLCEVVSEAVWAQKQGERSGYVS